MDRRVKYTKDVLKRTLQELLQTKALEDITVSELCRAADVNRNTFYYHYNTPMDLYAEIENDLMEQILNYTENSLKTFDNEELLKDTVNTVYKYRDTLYMFLTEKGQTNFYERTIELCHARVIVDWKKAYPNIPPEELEFMYDFVTGGTLRMIQTWMKTGFAMSPDNFGKLLLDYNNTFINEKLK